jgi:MFS family permease
LATTALVARKPLYYHGWNVVAACVLSQLSALGVPANCFSLFVGGWSVQFHTPISTLAIGLTVFSLSCAIWCPVVGYFTDRFSVRAVMALALVGVALFHFAIGSATASWQIIALYSAVLSLVVIFSTGVPSQALVSRWFVRRRGLAMGLTAFGIAMAGVIFPPIITAIMPGIGWRATWLLFGAIIGVVVAPTVFFTLRDRPGEADGVDYVTAEAQDAAPVHLPLKRIFGNRNFWITIIGFTPPQAVSMALSVTLAPIVMTKGYGLPTAGLLISASATAAILSKLGMGFLSDRFGNRLPLTLAPLSTGVGCVLLAAAHGLPSLFGAIVFIGVGQGVWTVLAAATAAEFGPRAFGRAFGFVSMLTPVATLAAPVVPWLYEHGVGYGVSLVGLAVFALLGAVTALFLKERRSSLGGPEPA